MIYFHIVILLFSCIPFLCNAMDNVSQQLILQQYIALQHSIALSNQNRDQSRGNCAVAFPTNDMVVNINHDSWSLFCAKTGKELLYIPRENPFTNFCLSKDGKKLAITDNQKLRVYGLQTSDFLHAKEIISSNIYGFGGKIVFLADNETVVAFDGGGFLFTMYTNKETAPYDLPVRARDVFPMCITSHPINDEFFITNYALEGSQYHAIVTIDTKGNFVVKKLIGNNDHTLDTGVYNPNGKVVAINDERKGYQFYSVENDYYFLTINSNKGTQHSAYSAIAFHPKKAFAALLNKDNNSVEFWDYTKKTEKPLATIPLEKIGIKSCKFSGRLKSHVVAFSPAGDKFVAISSHGNNCYVIPTPQIVYYDEDTKAQCTFINWAVKNNTHFIVPDDITQLIIKNVLELPDLYLLTQKLEREKKKQTQDSYCIIS